MNHPSSKLPISASLEMKIGNVNLSDPLEDMANSTVMGEPVVPSTYSLEDRQILHPFLDFQATSLKHHSPQATATCTFPLSRTRKRTCRLPVSRAFKFLVIVTLLGFFDFCIAIPSESKHSGNSMSRQLQSGVAKKQLQRALHKTKAKRRFQKSSADDESIDSVSKSTTTSPRSIAVESFLVRRKISLRLFIRSICFCFMIRLLLRCLQTIGVPYIRTVWQILYGNEDFSGTPPQDYLPSSADIYLASLIAASSKTFHILLPSPSMPSAAPILGLLASILAYVGLTYLIPHWSTRFRVFLDFSRTASISTTMLQNEARKMSDTSKQQKLAEIALVRVGPQDPVSQIGGKPNYLICPLYLSSSTQLKKANKLISSSSTSTSSSLLAGHQSFEHPTSCYFEVSQSRIYCDPETRQCVDGAPMLLQMPLGQLHQLIQAGGISTQQRKVALERYEPYNTFDLTSPTLRDAFVSRISSPLVVIQFLGKLVSVIEEGRGALFSLFGSLIEHYWDARQAIQSAEHMAQEVKTSLQDTSGCHVMIYENDKGHWRPALAGDLVPGDIFRLGDSNSRQTNGGNATTDELIVPVDALVIKGQCLTSEAVLTGESVPQVKIPLEFQQRSNTQGDRDVTLDLNADRSSILFAGTTMLRNGLGAHMGENSGGLVCMALRTGTSSSKGQLLRAMKGSANPAGVLNAQAEKDAMRLIGAMSTFAVLACASLFVRRDGKVMKVSPFRRVVQCTRIVLASIPSSLPLALAAVARSCSRMLRNRSDVVCSQPGSLLTAAFVDTVVFDKTGTLTADTQSLSKLVPPSSSTNDVIAFQRCLLAGCHSLVYFTDSSKGKQRFVGDPLDEAALRFSGWKYNQTNSQFFLSMVKAQLAEPSDPVALWQIKSFPFDPNRRLSTAIVLIKRKDSSFELWRVTKGAPDTLQHSFTTQSNDDLSTFQHQKRELERNGYRSIAMGAENLTKSPLALSLFPEGLSSSPSDLAFARSQGDDLLREDIEGLKTTEPMLTNYGFACFDASLRRSSPRIVRELKKAGIACIMLTGDSTDAAINIATRVDIVSTRKIGILELSEIDGETKLLRRSMTLGNEDASKSGTTELLTVKSARRILSQQAKAKLSLIASGDAIDHILGNVQNDVHRMIIQNLGSISVIARATPELKKKVVQALKNECGKTVMMCGDGVNDVAAIQAADVAAALLNGFGNEAEKDKIRDIDDERRLRKLNATNIGGNRGRNAAEAKKASHNEALTRMRTQIEKSHNEIKAKAAKRQGPVSDEESPQLTLEDMKEMISAIFQAYRDERDRTKKLQKGGGDAARILAEEKVALRLGVAHDQPDNNDEQTETQNIKPGEVSLVASFSCLHPSVDGVDAILREGVATAAAALATQQLIALHSLMSAFHLATLYRDGFRYSEKMLIAEISLSMNLDSLRYSASCIPRPRLPSSVFCRPALSMFETGSLISTVLQAISHLVFMSWGVSYARGLQHSTKTYQVEKLGLHNLHPLGNRLGKFVSILSSSPLHTDEENKKQPFSFFRRPPFQPNYETNVVFMFSVLQSALSALVTHRGKPFYQSVLENRAFCKILCFTVAFFVICVTDLMPRMTNFLDIKPFPTWHSKLVIVSLAVGNYMACVLSQWVGNQCSPDTSRTSCTDASIELESENQVAADVEEKLLQEEAEMNAKGIKLFFGLLIYFLVDIVAEGLKSL